MFENTMNYRIWDNVDKKFWASGQPVPLHTIVMSYREIVSSANITFLKVSDMEDRNGRKLGEGDVVRVEREDHRYNHFTVKYGTARRTMANGAEVEINGFFFERLESDGPFLGSAHFPICRNWYGGHDKEITHYIGNIHENRNHPNWKF